MVWHAYEGVSSIDQWIWDIGNEEFVFRSTEVPPFLIPTAVRVLWILGTELWVDMKCRCTRSCRL